MNNLILNEDDKFLTNEEIENINSIVHSHEFPWNVQSSKFTSDSGQELEDLFFAHVFCIDNLINSEFYHELIKPFNKFCLKHDIKVNKIVRAKTNLTTKNTNITHAPYHIDSNEPHNVFLYYINQSDGDTIFHNNGNVLHVAPMAGKAIIFDGQNYHSSLPPKNTLTRAVINIVYQ